MKNTKMILITFLISIATQAPIAFAEKAAQNHSIYQSTVTLENQDGQKMTLTQLKGNPVVAAMLYTSCPSSCPMTMADLKAIEKGLSAEERAKVHFVAFSFDSDHDTPKTLKAFLDKHQLNAKQWTFFHLSPKGVREIAALLGIRYQKTDSGDFDHSNIITVLNSEGEIAYQQIGVRQNPETSIKTLKQLLSAQSQKSP